MRAFRNRDDAHRRLSVFLRLQRLRSTAKTQQRTLLRILLVRYGALPTDPGCAGERGVRPSVLLFLTNSESLIGRIRIGSTTGARLPLMLRHASGYSLANKGKDIRSSLAYLGHASIVHTVKYTEMSPVRFKGFWD